MMKELTTLEQPWATCEQLRFVIGVPGVRKFVYEEKDGGTVVARKGRGASFAVRGFGATLAAAKRMAGIKA